MSKKRKNAELPETIEDLKRRNEDLEAEKMSLVARIQELETSNKDFEQEIRQLKENCKCPQDIAGNFRVVPLLAMRKIFEFLSFDDLKELRCVSSWFFNTVSDEFQSLFKTYHIYLCEEGNGMKQTKQIDAFERRGIKVLLKLSLKCETPDAAFVQEILKYKNIITEINIALYHDSYDYLLKEDFYFKSLEKMYISPEICSDDCCDEHLNLVKESCNKFISRYANQLQHLAISSMDFWEENDINVNNLAYITNLKSLSLKNFIDIDASFIIKSINFANVTQLELNKLRDIEMEDLNIRNLSVLTLNDVDPQLTETLLKSNSRTLTKLEISYYNFLDDHHEIEYGINDIQFSKLKYLNINGMFETDVLTLIKNSKNTIAEIHLSFLKDLNNLEYVTFLQLPHLKKVHLEIEFDYILSSKLVFSVINACDENTIILTNNEVINKSMLEELRQKFREN